ncbi:MAG: quinol:cytochrome C oxidoreductase [Pirellulaceae bacterium]|nr:quinol:cytochrome C oxidoreductase [Pirellulaceae bacterium]
MSNKVELPDDDLKMSGAARNIFLIAGATGVLALVCSLALTLAGDAEARSLFQFSYLQNLMFCLSISIGALFFVIMQHLSRAGWSVAVRRIAEILMAALLPMSILILPILVLVLSGDSTLYKWNKPFEELDALLQGKVGYLNANFFVIRVAIYFIVWAIVARFFFKKSLEQDQTGNKELTLKMQAISAPSTLLFALTVTFAAVDLIMTLDAHWFSTMFGVYFFAGCMTSFFSTMILLTGYLQANGKLVKSITIEHYHDYGKYLFGFVFFWSYIAFSQYMLIWYASIPEETGWFDIRQNNGWEYISLMLIFFHFMVPFLWLITKKTRRRKPLLTAAAILLLIMHWIDLYWLIIPEYSHGASPHFGVIDLCNMLGILGIYIASLAKIASNCYLIPIQDPRLGESLAFENH